MAGHSKFKNIMHRKGAQDERRAKQFAKVLREITVSVREGSPDPDANPRLRAAILAARQVNMPKDNLERAIKKASGESGGADYESVRYEGYGPGGTAVIVEALTDNRNRTAPVVRAAFSKFGGALGETNSVLFMFEHRGVIAYPLSAASSEEILEAAIEAGADDVDSSERHEVYTSFEDFLSVKEAMEKKFGEPETAETEWNPTTTSTLNLEQAQSMIKLIDTLEDDDDVQSVYANYDIPDDVAKEME